MSNTFDFIKIEPGFQKSVNLAYDLSDDSKVSDFIPSKAAVDVIEKLVLSTHPTSTQRAHILIGPYGKGKSHVILVLLSLLREKDQSQFNKLLAFIKSYNPELFNYVNVYLNSEQKLLPVVVQGSNNSLAQSFLNAIQIALRDAEFQELMPDTHFESAVKHIKNWQEKFPETAKKFEEQIEPESLDSFVLRLKQFDNEAYETFVKLYPILSSGGVFNPFGGVDVVELYENVASSIAIKGYNGIFLVYDEFSKYLESNIGDTSVSDIKMLQDFAEKCNRSGKTQLHLLLIAHKDIENYIDRLPKNKVDGWRGVSERFTHIEMQSNYDQIYDVIGQAIYKVPDGYKKYCDKNEELFNALSKIVKEQHLFSDLSEEQQEHILLSCYPLHPLTAYILPRLSELVAQNERTLFTFISDSGKNTLSFLIKQAVETGQDSFLVSPDALYDYFEPLFKKEVYTSEIYKYYSLVNSILVKVKEDDLQCKIVKTLALIYLIGRFEVIEPLLHTIIETFNYKYSSKTITNAVETLENKKFVIYARKSNGYLRLKSPSTSNVQLSIEKAIAKVKTHSLCQGILQEYASDLYLYPTAYNEEQEIIRYFDFRFISAPDLTDVTNWESKLSLSNADGVVYAVIAQKTDEIKQAKQYITEHTSAVQRAVFITPKKHFYIEDIAYKYKAISELLTEYKDDEAMVTELEIIFDDLDEVLNTYLESYLRPENGLSSFYLCGTKKKVLRKSHLANLLSDICRNVFKKTPRINNETINKNILPTTTINSRNRVVKGILATNFNPMLGLNSSSQDGAIARSVLCETHILENFSESPRIASDTDIQEKNKDVNENVFNVLTVIRRFFKDSSKKSKCFSELYDELTNPNEEIGLKKGVIPIFIAVVMHEMQGEVTLFEGDKEIEINELALSALNEKPEHFSVRVEKWSNEKIKYIDELSSLFKEFFNDREGNSYSSLAKAMQRWFISLPKYSRETKEYYEGNMKYTLISKCSLQFISLLKDFSINPYDLLFVKTPVIYECDDFGKGLIEKIARTKVRYENSLNTLKNSLINDLIKCFDSNAHPQASLCSVIKDWTDSLSSNTKNHVFDSSLKIFLDKCLSIENNDLAFLEEIAKPISGLRLEDWSNNTISSFLKTVSDIKESIDNFNNTKESEHLYELNSYSLVTVDNNGNKQIRNFSKIEYSEFGKMLKREILNSIDEMGESISDAEKRQVLIDALESLC
ncbi:hypothetical protein [Succinivibrio dextrinosolvens]|uniref:hypothetical protein n=1 Tax=Succinivibrio dextrinosolvens TaxID=83771 RepID=UPI00241C672A|nr:hypothetical protein [Succinivibrio dextrinosolvens]MBE6423244.1 hypothetical protein [Succinivibrio dextrinosolvens]